MTVDKLTKGYDFYVDGEWRKTRSNETIRIVSPYLKEEIGRIQVITQKEAEEAIKCAKDMQISWSQLTIRDRGDYLYRWIDELLQMKSEIAEVIMLEVGKTHADALKEVERTAELIRYTIEEATHMYGESLTGENYPGGNCSKISMVHRTPLGVVLAISPFNYPVNLAAAKIAPALISGNSVIFKPATQGAISGIKMIEALHKANLPEGTLNLVTGKGSTIGDFFTKHRDINMISFTGGTETGKHISQQSKMVTEVMELGEKTLLLCERMLIFHFQRIK